MDLFSWKNYSFSYADSEHRTLKNIDFTISESEFVLLCGASGSGKSTLLRGMKKHLAPYGTTEGSLCYKGIETEKLDDRTDAAQIGFVMQNPEVQIVTDEVWHELAFGLESLGMSREDMHRRIAEMVSFFGMQEWFHKKTYELSGGQKQMVNLASVMAMHPDILILDEPTAQLDPIAAENFIATLSKIHRELGTAIFLSEHRLEEVLPLTNRVLLLEDGEIAMEGTPKQMGAFFAQNQTHRMFAGMPAALRVYAKVEEQKEQDKIPLTVGEGKAWLREWIQREERVTLWAAGKEETSQEKEIENEVVLRAENLYFAYEKDRGNILNGISLELRRGEFFAILGGNGAGKSTLLKCLCGGIKPYRGKIARGVSCAMLPQNPQALFTEITVEEELIEAFYGMHKKEDEIRTAVAKMLERMRLSGYEKTHPYDLSGGEQQRLALGKILLREPQILFLDEPTKGFDPLLKRELAELLQREVLQKGRSVLMVSHDLNFCAEYADTCGMLFDGILVNKAKPKDFFKENYFYTTQANRLAKEYWKDALTCAEVIQKCEELKM